MGLRVGILTTAHMHIWSYVHCFGDHPDAALVGVWDDDEERGRKFADKAGLPFVTDLNTLLDQVDAVCVTSENNRHTDLVEIAAKAGKHILCEKPLVTSEADAIRMEKAVKEAGVKLMTAFPCRFSPAFQKLKARVKSGDIGAIKAICATNKGKCPFDWFVKPELSGGGAMIDHVVHVTDLLRDLLGEEPVRVQAQIGNNMYSKEWDDTAMVTIEFPSGIFATIDSSWSRPQTFKTWGDVTMNVVGDGGVMELDMFGQGLEKFQTGTLTHTLAGYGSDLDKLMVNAFVEACLNDSEVPVTLYDGLQAARVAIAGYKSVKEGQPVSVN